MAQYIASRAVKEDIRQEAEPSAANPLDKMKLEVIVSRMPRLIDSQFSVEPTQEKTPAMTFGGEMIEHLKSPAFKRRSTMTDETSILEAVRRSLKGEAARAAMRIRPKPSLTTLLAKCDSLYGTVKGSDIIMAAAAFYNRQQRVLDEDVSAWSCRVEDLVAKAVWWNRGVKGRRRGTSQSLLAWSVSAAMSTGLVTNMTPLKTLIPFEVRFVN